MYRCPLCQLSLQSSPSGYQCPNRHQFDRAKEGYVNLLPVQQKKSLDPGDSAEMIQARRSFLEAGFYQPLSDAVNKMLASVLQQQTAPSILDIGCGEGYYSNRLQHFIQQQQLAALPTTDPAPAVTLCGIDISKAAIKAAAKKYRQLQFAVASSYHLPFADQSFSALLRIYAPSQSSELARVCKASGWLCTVTPAPQHLIELKQKIYQEPRLHSAEIAEEAGFSHQQRQQLSWHWQPQSPTQLEQLLQMIPLGYRLTAEVRQHLMHELPAVTLDFYLDLYQRQ
ncbi:23S rRNA (guanine(745)-N(1))-methyltransferase [Rheinheimera riviphila]|uniref:23S rRNA (Guanine(745)-N(1))-methyltransferase n=1 Tax=Rheinheimera riviphila TaxID=1834037 RepID=A0A437R1L1_9GAMM|nr:23S rRNA (guanine(745)-N(1))-methyltransferase [Rheinheimera riviphila]RVU40587.1 23S rRNA (guanine(745)-N(1))-methyltransferase [Rheinheimera riviphila]